MPIYEADTLSKIMSNDGVLAAYAVSTADPALFAYVGDESLWPVLEGCKGLAAHDEPRPGEPRRARALVAKRTMVVTQFDDAIVVVAFPTGDPVAKSLNRSLARLHRGPRTSGRPAKDTDAT